MTTVKFVSCFLLTFLVVVLLNIQVFAGEKLNGVYFIVQYLAKNQEYNTPVYQVVAGLEYTGLRINVKEKNSKVFFTNNTNVNFSLKMGQEPSQQVKDLASGQTVSFDVTFQNNTQGKLIVQEEFYGRAE